MLLDWIMSNEQQENQQGYAGGGLIDSDKSMWDWQSGNAIASGITAGSELFKLIGDIGDGFARVNDDAHQAQLNQIGSQSIGYGSANQRFNNASNIQFANTNLTRRDFGGMSGGEIALDAVKNIGSAAAVGNTLLPGIGGFIGAAAGGLATGIKAIGNYITSGNTRDKAIAQAISINNGKRAGMQYNNNIANDLETKN
jgi:hypothetical protein